MTIYNDDTHLEPIASAAGGDRQGSRCESEPTETLPLVGALASAVVIAPLVSLSIVKLLGVSPAWTIPIYAVTGAVCLVALSIPTTADRNA